MIHRSKAPLRIGLAGGGTDVSPYSDIHGGAVLNATISLYAHAHIEPLDGDTIVLQALDSGEQWHGPRADHLPIDGKFDLAKGVYNRIRATYGLPPTGLRLCTFVDAPAASGLGTSSTLVVAIIGAFVEMLRLPLGEYDIAQLAYDIERRDLGMPGGRQDQYAATFGGVNYMEFDGDKVVVNPLRIKREYLFELENNLLLYYTALSRESAGIIERQADNAAANRAQPIEAMHQLKRQAVLMKEALLKGQLNDIGGILDYGFRQKKKMAEGISNARIEQIYDAARKAGAVGGKISGAGGGGFMTFYCPGISRHEVAAALAAFGGEVRPYQFVGHGLESWTI